MNRPPARYDRNGKVFYVPEGAPWDRMDVVERVLTVIGISVLFLFVFAIALVWIIK